MAVKKSTDYPSLVALCDAVNANGSTTVIKVSAPWCSPCKKLHPILERLSEQFTGVLFLEVDIEDPAADLYVTPLGISAVPTILVYRSGELRAMISSPKELQIVEAIERARSEA